MARTTSQKSIARAQKNLFGVDDDDNWFERGMKNTGEFFLAKPMEVGGMVTDFIGGDLMGKRQYQRDWSGDDAIDIGLTALETAVPGYRAAKTAIKGGQAALKSGIANKAKDFLTPKSYIKPGLKVGAGATAVGAIGDQFDPRNPAQQNDPNNPNQRSLEDLMDDPVYQQNVAARQGQRTSGERGLANLANAESMRDFEGKRSHNQNIEEGIQRDLLNRARRDLKREDDEYNRRAIQESRTRSIADGREADMREAWAKSPYGQVATGMSFDELDPETQSEMRERYVNSKRAGAYDSSVDAAQKRRAKTLAEIDASGSYYVDPNDPTNENKAPGQVSRDQFMERSGLTNPGTFLSQNPDGTFNTGETGAAFERAGGMDTANQIFNPPARSGSLSVGTEPYRPANSDAALANISNQVGGDNSFTYADGSKGPSMNEGSIRTTSNMQDYGDAAFQNREDALNYLNRGQLNEMPTVDNPAPGPEPETETDEDGMPLWPWITGAGLALAEGGRRYLNRKIPGSGKLIEKFGPKAASKLNPKAAFPTPKGVPVDKAGIPRVVTPEQYRRGQTGLDISSQNIINKARAQQNAPQLALPERGVPRKAMENMSDLEKFRRVQSGGLDPSGRRIAQQQNIDLATPSQMSRVVNPRTKGRFRSADDMRDEIRRSALHNVRF